MPEKPAARVTDRITCPIVVPGPPPVPHDPTKQGNPITINTSMDVEMDNLNAACVGAQSVCLGPPPQQPVISGAMGVLINNKPPGREGEFGAHGGKIASGSGTVFIGGPSCVGNPVLGTDECHKAALGRVGGGPYQNHENCGLEASRQVLNRATGSSVSEKQMLGNAQKHGASSTGATNQAQVQAVLGAAPHNIATTLIPQGMAALKTALQAGRGVIAEIWASNLWTKLPQGMAAGTRTGGHAIFVTGAELDENGDVVNVIVNDTGLGKCGQAIEATKFEDAMKDQATDGHGEFVVTDKPIW